MYQREQIPVLIPLLVVANPIFGVGMNFTARIGLVVISQAVLSVVNDGTKDGLCSAEGLFGNLLNVIVSYMRKHGVGCTLHVYQFWGKYDHSSQSYDGLIGALQAGEIDIMSLPVYYPLDHPFPRLMYTTPFFEDTMTIQTFYHVSDNAKSGDLLDMFGMVPTNLWIGYFVSFFTFVLVSYFGCRLLKEKCSAIWMTICAFLDQDNYPLGTLFLNVLSFVSMLGMFFMMTYAGNCMSTDLVTFEKPTVVKTYDDIIEKHVQIYFVDSLPELEKFRSAPKGSKESHIYARSSTLDTHVEVAWVAGFKERMLNQEVGVIGRPIVARACATMLLAQGVPEGTFAYVAPDKDHAKEFTNVFLLNKDIEQVGVIDCINQGMKRMFEFGILEFAYTKSAATVVEFYQPVLPSMERKITSRVEESSADVVAINYGHLHRVMVMIVCGISLAGTVLLAEIAHARFVSHRKVRQVKPVIFCAKPKVAANGGMIGARRNKVAPMQVSNPVPVVVTVHQPRVVAEVRPKVVEPKLESVQRRLKSASTQTH